MVVVSDNLPFAWRDRRDSVQATALFLRLFTGLLRLFTRRIRQVAGAFASQLGSFARHLAMGIPVNNPQPGAGNIQARRPFNALYPNVTTITEEESIGNSAYNSLQVSFVQRANHGLFFGGNYVWAHALNNSGGDGGADGTIPQDPNNRRAEWAHPPRKIGRWAHSARRCGPVLRTDFHHSGVRAPRVGRDGSLKRVASPILRTGC